MSTVVGLHGAGSTERMFLTRNNLSWQRLYYYWIDVYLRMGMKSHDSLIFEGNCWHNKPTYYFIKLFFPI